MKTQSAKAKGRRLQQLVRDAILESFAHLTGNDVRSTSMGSSGIDVLLSEAGLLSFPFAVECKSHSRMAIYSLFQQSVDNCPPDLYPLLVVRQNRSDPLAVVRLEDFMEIIRACNWSSRTKQQPVQRGDKLHRVRNGSDRKRRAKVATSEGTTANPSQ